jgi:hypothetical protein
MFPVGTMLLAQRKGVQVAGHGKDYFNRPAVIHDHEVSHRLEGRNISSVRVPVPSEFT